MTAGAPTPFDPDREYTAWVTYPYAQLRVELGVERGGVRWFVVQLEYNRRHGPCRDDDWAQVARFDHHPEAGWGHDVVDEGLHLDLYRDGQKFDVERGFPPVPVNDAPAYCETFLYEHADHYLNQFERWHDLTGTERYSR